MGSGNIADTIRVVTVRVIGTLARSIVYTGEVHCTVAIGTFVAILIMTTFVLIQVANYSTLNVGWPVTHRSNRPLILGVETEGPLSIAHRVCGGARATFHQTGLQRLTILFTNPESATVYNID